jgi:hypothetical protein
MIGARTKHRTKHRWLARAAGGLAGVAVVGTGVMGFAHTKPGRPLLAWMGMTTGMSGSAAKGGCPFGYDKARTPEEKDAALRSFAAAHPASERAASRPALAFELGKTTRADVQRWAESFGVACRHLGRGSPNPSDADLDCSDVPDAALPEAARGAHVTSAWLTFDAHDALATAVVIRRASDAEAIRATFAAATASLTTKAGPSKSVTGDPTVAYLSTGLLYQVSAEYAFTNYHAVVRATNVGDGFALTEDYRLLPD